MKGINCKMYLLILLMNFSLVSLAQSSINMEQLDKQGHRGCRGLYPENTIPGFLKAIDLGVTTLEMDLVITKDKKVILSHEPFFNHEITTLPNGEYVSESNERELNIYEMVYSEVKKYDVGQKVHPRFLQQQKIKANKPLLAEVIDSVEMHAKTNNKQPLFYNIETKIQPQTDNVYHPEPQEFVDLIMAVILEKKIQNRVIVQSFDSRSLQYLHQKYPSVKTALLVEAFDKKSFEKQIEDLGFTPTIYSPAQELVDLNLVQECRSKKIKLIPWTVNDLETIRRFVALGVDGIITDYPNLFFEE
jgi:glycerophosphoryl diester phosphodiesterase